MSPGTFDFPPLAYLQYKDNFHFNDLIENVSNEKIASCSELLAKVVREKYSPGAIYGGMWPALWFRLRYGPKDNT